MENKKEINSISEAIEVTVENFDEWLKTKKFDLGMLVSLKKLIEAEWVRAEKMTKDLLKLIDKDQHNEQVNKVLKDVTTLAQLLEDRATIIEVYIKENKEKNTH